MSLHAALISKTYYCLQQDTYDIDTVLEIFKQSIGARNRVGRLVAVPTRQASQPGGIGSLESILELLKCLKIRALEAEYFLLMVDRIS